MVFEVLFKKLAARLRATPRAFKPDKARAASFFNSFKNKPETRVRRELKQLSFCAKKKLAYKKNKST